MKTVWILCILLIIPTAYFLLMYIIGKERKDNKLMQRNIPFLMICMFVYILSFFYICFHG